MPRILVGVVGAPHGIRGEVRVKSFTGRPAAIAAYGPLQVEGRASPLAVRSVRPVRDDMLVVRFAEVDSRSAAEALNGTRLYIDRSALPATEAEEFYHADLIGLGAETADGRPLGRVRGILNHGAGDILEIVGESAETLLVAFTAAFVPRIDVAGGRLVVADEALIADPSDADLGDAAATRPPGPAR